MFVIDLNYSEKGKVPRMHTWLYPTIKIIASKQTIFLFESNASSIFRCIASCISNLWARQLTTIVKVAKCTFFLSFFLTFRWKFALFQSDTRSFAEPLTIFTSLLFKSNLLSFHIFGSNVFCCNSTESWLLHICICRMHNVFFLLACLSTIIIMFIKQFFFRSFRGCQPIECCWSLPPSTCRKPLRARFNLSEQEQVNIVLHLFIFFEYLFY